MGIPKSNLMGALDSIIISSLTLLRPYLRTWPCYARKYQPTSIFPMTWKSFTLKKIRVSYVGPESSDPKFRLGSFSFLSCFRLRYGILSAGKTRRVMAISW